MKNILTIVAVTLVLTSCGTGETETCSTNTTDSTCVAVDSTCTTTTTEVVTVTTDSVSTTVTE